MNKVILFGATGNVGKCILNELLAQNYVVTAVVRNGEKARLLPAQAITIVADITSSKDLEHICDDQDIVISALGKSVSPSDNSKATFVDVDYLANSAVLEQALVSGIKKFVYISAFHSEKYPHLTYFKVHHAFEQKLIHSGINYSIIKPPAVFSAFLEMIPMARKGRLATIGFGDKKTNPIYEGDLARICVDAIKTDNSIIEAGGPVVYTRRELAEVIQKSVAPNTKVKSIPFWLVKTTFPFLKLFAPNTYDKFAFFVEVIQTDTIAPPHGAKTFETYIQEQISREPAQ